MIRIAGLRKRFGRREVLKGIDLELARGKITALVGPNAAGKSTLIKIILGLVKLGPGDGQVLIDEEALDGDGSYRSRIGYMAQAARFPEQLTGREVLELVQRVRGPTVALDDELISRFEVGPALAQKVGTLSGGTRQKLNAAIAFLFGPPLLILDEPTAGLDPVASSILKDKVARVAGAGTTVLLTSHILSEVEELAGDIVFLVEGRVAFHGSVAELIERSGERRLERAIARLLAPPR